MLETLIPQLQKELNLNNDVVSVEAKGVYKLSLSNDYPVVLTDVPDGCTLKCSTIPAPEKALEESFFARSLNANLFGRGTNGAVLGMTEDGSMMTLTQTVDSSIKYKDFRLLLEEFMNAVDFWRSEVQKK